MLVAVCPMVIKRAERGERLDALDQKWAELLFNLDMMTVVLPNHPANILPSLERLAPDAVIFSGGGDVRRVRGNRTERDVCENALLSWLIDNDKPGVGVCRGFQAMLIHAGCELHQIANHVRTRHKIVWANGNPERETNSFHEYGTIAAPPNVNVMARAHDRIIEAAHLHGTKLRGVMWHPERESPFAAADLAFLSSALRGGT
jgi:N5-(cytidine 5'-diphosphoramidyl)-L-glutamine hydrolase